MKIFKHRFLWVFLTLFGANIIFFWKFYLKGLLPFPGNLLVSYYFPWNGGGFAGFDPWTTRKAVIGMDVIRQMYPWRTLGDQLLKQGAWPLWNPYNFSGTPLLANLQSSFFFPGNLLTLPLEPLVAWTSQVIFLPFILSLFSFIFLRSLKLSRPASVFGAIGLAGMSYLSVWSEQIMVIQSVLFLPLALWSLNRFSQSKKKFYLLFVPLFLAFSILGGHMQTVTYSFILVFAYSLYKKIPGRYILLSFCLGIVLSAIQLFPSLELYLASARDNPGRREFITTTALPLKNAVTILAPDFFGNPATNNFRGNNYDNSLAYGGIIALVLTAQIFWRRKMPAEIRFWGLVAAGGLLFSFPPLAYLFSFLHIPVLGTSYLSRLTFVFEFSLIVLGAFGFEYLIEKANPQRMRTLPVSLLIAAVYLGLWAVALLLPSPDRGVTLRNLLLPTLLAGLTMSAIFLAKTKLRPLIVIILLAAIALETGYFFNKYQPFSKKDFVFPSHPVFTFLQKNSGYDRYFGLGPAYIDSNFATFYRVFTPEGYDPLFIGRYGQFLAAAANGGKLPEIVPPSDAVIGSPDKFYFGRLLDILGVKFIVDRTDSPDMDQGQNFEKFPASDYVFVSQIRQWKFYRRYNAFPRAFLAGQYSLVPDKDSILSTFYNPQFNARQNLILEEMPDIFPEMGGTEKADITSYNPNSVQITTESEKPKLLFLSDNFYPGWKVTIDSRPAKIYRADYTFRAVALQSGKHTVVFTYQPQSFYLGLVISTIGLIFLCVKFSRWRYSA